MPRGPHDSVFEALGRGRRALDERDFEFRRRVFAACIPRVAAAAERWVTAACEYKRIDPRGDLAAEEFGGGPVFALRALRLCAASHLDLARGRLPSLPGVLRAAADGCWHVPVFPTRSMFDALLFLGYRATVLAAADPLQIEPPRASPGIAVVLGAGNVTGVPVGDVLSMIAMRAMPTLWKLHPQHDGLAEVFADAFAPLLEADLLRIVRDGEVRSTPGWLTDARIAHVHLTGAAATFEAVRYATHRGATLSCELGNVTPILVTPTRYRAGELEYQARHVAATIANNASFNCVAPKVLLTCRRWPQRARFVGMVRDALAAMPTRYGFHPGAAARYERFARTAAPADGTLPWTLHVDVDPELAPALCREESFVPVCAEIPLEADDAAGFVRRAVDFCNTTLTGELAAMILAPPRVRRSPWFDAALAPLRAGTLGVNQWPALAFAFAATPWGSYDARHNRADAPKSGMAFVNDPFCLRAPVRTVLEGPFRPRPTPAWFADRRGARAIFAALCACYAAPSARSALRVLRAVFG